MKTLTLKKKHFDSENFYIGKHDLSDFEGNVEISPKVGVARFEAIKVSGYLKGTSIFSNKGIEAGRSIEAGESIEAGRSIEAGWSIKAGEGIEADRGIRSGLSMTSGSTLESGGSILAGTAVHRELTEKEKIITCTEVMGKVVLGNVQLV